VPLMVLVSGMAFSLSFRAQDAYGQYVWKRVKRLLFPAWLFLTGYFSFFLLFDRSSAELTSKKIVESFLLLDGIGFVWIIRVFLLVALMAPVTYSFFQRRHSDRLYLMQLFGIFVIYEVARFGVSAYLPGPAGQLVSLSALYLVPYSLVFALGLLIPEAKQRTNMLLALFFGTVFVTMLLALRQANGGYVPTQVYKYPPSLYYFSYAIAISIALWFVSNPLWRLINRSKVASAVVLFVAQNSLWIYLWHIPLAKLSGIHFLLHTLLMLVVATGLTYGQVWAVNRFLLPKIQRDGLRKDVRSLLTG